MNAESEGGGSAFPLPAYNHSSTEPPWQKENESYSIKIRSFLKCKTNSSNSFKNLVHFLSELFEKKGNFRMKKMDLNPFLLFNAVTAFGMSLAAIRTWTTSKFYTEIIKFFFINCMSSCNNIQYVQYILRLLCFKRGVLPEIWQSWHRLIRARFESVTNNKPFFRPRGREGKLGVPHLTPLFISPFPL